MKIDQKCESIYEGYIGKVTADYDKEFDLYATTPDAEFFSIRTVIKEYGNE